MIILAGHGEPDVGVIMRQAKARGLVVPTLISSLFVVATSIIRFTFVMVVVFEDPCTSDALRGGPVIGLLMKHLWVTASTSLP